MNLLGLFAGSRKLFCTMLQQPAAKLEFDPLAPGHPVSGLLL